MWISHSVSINSIQSSILNSIMGTGTLKEGKAREKEEVVSVISDREREREEDTVYSGMSLCRLSTTGKVGPLYH